MRKQVDRLLEVLRGGKRYLITTHNNPDPDSVASSFALQYLIRKLLKKNSTIGYAGIVGRAENKAMLKECRIKLVPLESLDLDKFDRICLLDTQFSATNHSLPKDRVPTVVIDHHQRLPGGERLPYKDVRPGYGAISTILTEYLIDLRLEIEKRVATALLFGIRSDTFNLSRRTTSADIRAYGYLVSRIDKELLSMIENPPLPRKYFRILHRALESAKIYGDVVLSDLDRIDNPDAVSEMADFLLKLSGVSWSVVMGSYKKALYLSIRTDNHSKDAAQVIVEAVGDRGTAGGHDVMAGGMIPLDTEEDLKKMVRTIKWRLLTKISPLAKRSKPIDLIP